MDLRRSDFWERRRRGRKTGARGDVVFERTGLEGVFGGCSVGDCFGVAFGVDFFFF